MSNNKRAQTYRKAHTVKRGGKTFNRRGSKVSYWQGAGSKAGAVAGVAVVGVAAFSISAASVMVRGLFVAVVAGVAAGGFAWSEWNARQKRTGGETFGAKWTRWRSEGRKYGDQWESRGRARIAADLEARDGYERRSDQLRKEAVERRRQDRAAAAERTNEALRANERLMAAHQAINAELAKGQLDDDVDNDRADHARLAADIRRAGGR